MTTALFLLRSVQIGLKIDDLDRLERGVVLDMMSEASNDDVNYPTLASQEDYDRW